MDPTCDNLLYGKVLLTAVDWMVLLDSVRLNNIGPNWGQIRSGLIWMTDRGCPATVTGDVRTALVTNWTYDTFFNKQMRYGDGLSQV